MRISDWSSDVCSSDLRGAEIDLQLERGLACFREGFGLDDRADTDVDAEKIVEGDGIGCGRFSVMGNMHLQNSACPELVEACPELRRRGPFFSSTPVEERAVLRQAQNERIRDYSISKITASTARLSPCAALTVFTVPRTREHTSE